METATRKGKNREADAWAAIGDMEYMPTLASREHVRQRIEKQVAQFLAEGGEIRQIPAGVSAKLDERLSNNRRYWKEVNWRLRAQEQTIAEAQA